MLRVGRGRHFAHRASPVGAPGWVPIANGIAATVSADFANQRYWYSNGNPQSYSNFSSWVAALGGTFSRSGNAMMYDASGKLTYAPNNMALYSEDLTQFAWKTLGAGTVNSPTSLTVGPADAAEVYQQVSCSVGETYILSCTLSGTGQIELFLADDTGADGTITTVTLSAVPTVYQAIHTVVAGALEDIILRPVQGSGNAVTFTATKFQLSRITYQTSPFPYVKTTAAAYYGARFDYDPVALTAKGILLEGSRTNLAPQSNQFDTWSASANTTVASAAGVSPDGTTNAWKLKETTTTVAAHQITQAVTKAASSLTYTGSIYAKAVERTRLEFCVNDGVNGAQVVFDLSGVQIGVAPSFFGAGFSAASATITNVGNGWVRCTLTATSSTLTTIQIQSTLDAGSGTGATNDTYAGVVGDGILIYGAQLEQASFASSYIPTTTASVTRAADITNTGIAETSIGTVYAKGDSGDNAGGAPRYWGALAGFNSYLFLNQGNGAAGIYNGSVALNTANSATLNVAAKFASSWDGTGRAVCLNAGTVATDANTQATGSSLTIGYDGVSGTSNTFGHIAELALWTSVRASNSEMQRLTT